MLMAEMIGGIILEFTGSLLYEIRDETNIINDGDKIIWKTFHHIYKELLI